MNTLLAAMLVLVAAPDTPPQGSASCSRAGQWISASMTKLPRGTDFCVFTYSALIPDPPGHPVRVILKRRRVKNPKKKKTCVSVPDEQRDIMKRASCFEVQVECYDMRSGVPYHVGGTVLVAK